MFAEWFIVALLMCWVWVCGVVYVVGDVCGDCLRVIVISLISLLVCGVWLVLMFLVVG